MKGYIKKLAAGIWLAAPTLKIVSDYLAKDPLILTEVLPFIAALLVCDISYGFYRNKDPYLRSGLLKISNLFRRKPGNLTYKQV